MGNDWSFARNHIVNEEHYYCFWCKVKFKRLRRSEEAHHGIFGTDKNNPRLDVCENLVGLCHHCHHALRGEVHSHEFKCILWAWKVMIGEYDMQAWVDSLGFITNENYDKYINGDPLPYGLAWVSGLNKIKKEKELKT